MPNFGPRSAIWHINHPSMLYIIQMLRVTSATCVFQVTLDTLSVPDRTLRFT